jgi:type I restriction enzyme S subunit
MSFPRYKSYKESGVEWLGEVPYHWDVKRLKFLCDIQTGDKDTVDAVEGGLYPFFVRSQTVERINSFTFDCEAVLTAGDGVGVGKVFHYHNGPFDFHQRVYMLTNFRNVSGSFLFHYLKENFYKVALEGGAKSTVDSLRMPLFLNFIVTVPPIEEQNTIVQFVVKQSAKIDTLIAEQQRLIALLAEKRQATISHAVTKGLNPDAPMKDSGIEWLGEVPERWEVKRLRFVAELNPSKSEVRELDKETMVSFLPMETISEDGFLNLDREKAIREVETGYTYFRDGDVVVAKITPCFENGKGALMRGLLNGIGFGTTELIVARPRKEETSGKYLYWLFIWFLSRICG